MSSSFFPFSSSFFLIFSFLLNLFVYLLPYLPLPLHFLPFLSFCVIILPFLCFVYSLFSSLLRLLSSPTCFPCFPFLLSFILSYINTSIFFLSFLFHLIFLIPLFPIPLFLRICLFSSNNYFVHSFSLLSFTPLSIFSLSSIPYPLLFLPLSSLLYSLTSPFLSLFSFFFPFLITFSCLIYTKNGAKVFYIYFLPFPSFPLRPFLFP